MGKILIIEDEDLIREELEILLSNEGYRVESAADIIIPSDRKRIQFIHGCVTACYKHDRRIGKAPDIRAQTVSVPVRQVNIQQN